MLTYALNCSDWLFFFLVRRAKLACVTDALNLLNTNGLDEYVSRLRNARDTKMTTRVTEGTRQERHPRSSHLADPCWRACPSPPNMMRKRLLAVQV